MGRLMRGPEDHGADDGAGATGADDAAAAAAAAADTAAADAAAAAADGADAGTDGGDGAEGAADDGASLIGGAKTKAEGEGDGAGDGADDDKGDKEPVVPETYELEPFQVGEGDDAVEITIDKELLDAATPKFKEAKLTNDQVKALAPLALEVESRVHKQMSDQFAATTADWAKQAKADPEIGGKNFPVTMENVAKALDHFGAVSKIEEVEVVQDGKTVKVKTETEPFRKFLNETGLGNHPALIRMFAKVGAAAGEDGTLPRGDKGAAVRKSPEQVLYPDDQPKG